MRCIYGPKGPAGEYAGLAANLRCRCEHGCLYCYAPSILRISKELFHQKRADDGPARREKMLEKFTLDCAEIASELFPNKRRIFLSFLDDPCQPLEKTERLTQRAIEIAHAHGQRVNVLTKGHREVVQDVLAVMRPGDAFGVTLTCRQDDLARHWEPGAERPCERIELLREAKARGLETRVSFEPVVNTKEVLEMIEEVRPFTDLIQVGALNRHPEELPEVTELRKTIRWVAFAEDVRVLLTGLGGRWYMKKDLTRPLGCPEGLRGG